tara:strand:+ start:846 stop:1835 length:990 start_codon:yes stop_codon:yes gene_type:complete
MISLSCSFLRIQAFHSPLSRHISSSLVSMRSKKKNTNEYSFQDDLLVNKRNKKNTPSYKPKSHNQKIYVEHLQNKQIPVVLGVGPAGSGKTMFACLQAIQDLNAGKIHKIILTRPVVPVEEEELGFLPGNLVKKMDPWTRPIFDIFSEFYQQRDIENMIHCGVLEISPLAYMRGRTFKNSFIIADEMQNSTPNQMLMLTTRIGQDSKMVITGDLKQSDRSINNGLLDFMDKITDYNKKFPNLENNIKTVLLNTHDVQRSEIVRQILNIYGSSNLHDVQSFDSIQTDNYDATNIPKTIDQRIQDDSSNYDAALIPKNKLPKNHFNNDSAL